MVWLISLPIWVLFWSYWVSNENKNKSKTNIKAFMVISSLALIFVLGLRSRFTGTGDTYAYAMAFSNAKEYSNLVEYLTRVDVFDGFFLLSESGFYVFTWIAGQIFPEAQWFLLLTVTVIVCCTAIFISQNSEDPAVSWIVFICLGLMTFAMNGMRQALAMSICLLAYRYAKENKPVRFFLIVLLAVLFHKSAMFFLVIYLMRKMKWNFKSISALCIGVFVFFIGADRFSFLYDSLVDKSYSSSESFESGGIVVVLTYIIALLLSFLFIKDLKNPTIFFPIALTVLGFALYLGRFTSTQIYERISYYFSYFLMLVFPMIFQRVEKDFRLFLKICFFLCAIALFVYRVYGGAFSDFAMFWQE